MSDGVQTAADQIHRSMDYGDQRQAIGVCAGTSGAPYSAVCTSKHFHATGTPQWFRLNWGVGGTTLHTSSRMP